MEDERAEDFVVEVNCSGRRSTTSSASTENETETEEGFVDEEEVSSTCGSSSSASSDISAALQPPPVGPAPLLNHHHNNNNNNSVISVQHTNHWIGNSGDTKVLKFRHFGIKEVFENMFSALAEKKELETFLELARGKTKSLVQTLYKRFGRSNL